jgi:lipid A 3-O-deacylase
MVKESFVKMHRLVSSLIMVCLLALSVQSKSFAAGGETLDSDPMETWGWRAAMITSLALTLASNPLNADEYTVSLMGNPKTAGIKVGFRWHPESDMALLEGTNFSHYYHLGYNYWQSTETGGQEGVNNVLEFVPVFRYSWAQQDVFSYVETSVGLSVFAKTAMDDREFSTNFQFANGLAIGGFISAQTSWSLQLQHYSNNSIKLPNNGINWYNLNIAYRY